MGLERGCTVDSVSHHVHLGVSGPDIVDDEPVFLESVCAHGERDWHFKEEVPGLQGVWRDLEAGHDGQYWMSLLPLYRGIVDQKHN